MRKVGEFPGREPAERFHRFLAQEKIGSDLRDAEAGQYAVWVHDEDLLQVASAYFDAFKATPDDPRFKTNRPVAAEADRQAPARRRRMQPNGSAVVTFSLIGLAVVATLVSNLPNGILVTRLLYFSEYMGRTFPEIREGQVWRLITPIFLHGGFLHLLFNMMWLYQLGGAIEALEGALRLVALALVLAVLANTTQYLISGPNFVGMSGVVYGLLGYIWMMSRHSAVARYEMPQQTVYFMVAWMVVCLTGLIGDVANAEHVTGFLAGTAWGFLRSGYIGAARRRRRYKNGL